MRKFTQLVQSGSSLVGLCDDGSTWLLDGKTWLELPLLPQSTTEQTEVVEKPVKKKAKKVEEILYWIHAESDTCGIAKDEKDLENICNSDGLAEPCSKEVYDACVAANKNEEQKDIPVLNHVDLKSACLKSARHDSANRDKLKALLKTYGAVKAVDVPTDKLAEVIGKIEAGEF